MGLKPRRTIRVALWSGEEEGLLGSLAYVKEHFGTAENPKAEWSKLDCYFNVDTGTGRIRGASVFGPPEAGAALRPVFMQFEDFGVGGVGVTNSRATGEPTARRSITPDCRAWEPSRTHRIQQPDTSHQSRHLRAHHPRRCEERCGHHRRRGVARGQSGPDDSQVHQGDDARAGSGPVRRNCRYLGQVELTSGQVSAAD